MTEASHSQKKYQMQKKNEKKQVSVLLVDDDANLLKSVKECLELEGNFDIETALSSDEAFQKMSCKKPDVIVCDIQMPRTSGFEFLKILRDSGNSIPFIVFTMTDKKEVALQAFHLGANGFIGKYGGPAVVYPKLKQCIEDSTKNSVKEKEE